jgi:branched-chain amino acid aminotransferase
MAFDETLKVWKNGKIIPWNEATIHVASHVVHYGSSVFEGIRCYHTKSGSAIFRLTDHVQRLFDSAKIYRMPIIHSADEIRKACKDVVRANAFEEAYVRPVVFRGYGALGVDPSSCPVDTFILTWKWGAYLGKEGLERGVDVKISSWKRLAPNTLPTMAKAGANYMSSQLMKLEAIADGYAESIALTDQGFLSEGSGENLFVVMKGKLFTPPMSASILNGITRDSVIRIAKELGFDVLEQNLPRESLYLADEVFFTGTAAEVTPIRSVDRVQVGSGGRGPITAAIQTRFFDIISGKSEDRYGWLDYL